jgi:hypothetical protein
LIRITRTSRAIASSIFLKFSACACWSVANSMRSIFETPSTRSATGRPKRSRISLLWWWVSSTTSCSSAAMSACASRCHSARILATANGWVMYGSPLARYWPDVRDARDFVGLLDRSRRRRA